MAVSNPVASNRELQLIKKEIEAQGEFQSQERIERKTDIDSLRIELQALRETLGALLPEFQSTYSRTYDRLLRQFDPEQSQPGLKKSA